MPSPRRWFLCLARAVRNRGLRGLVGQLPFGEVLYDVAADFLGQLQSTGDDVRPEVEAASNLSGEALQQVVAEVVAEVVGDQPAEVRDAMTGYLMQVPATIRQTLRRPSDLTGTTVPPDFRFREPHDAVPVIPARLARFRIGQRAPGFSDWELVELLGVGGFGEVWLAENRHLGERTALKFCLDASAAKSLLNEARLLKRLKVESGSLPNVVPLLGTSLASEPPALMYRYIPGGDLTGLFRDWKALPDAERIDRAARLVRDLARAVGAAHRLPEMIVHRDLKPANVLIEKVAGEQFMVWIADFGIGGIAADKAIRDERSGTTTRGQRLSEYFRGAHSPGYASPEQKREMPANPRDDVYAMGVIWYQAILADITKDPTGDFDEVLEEMGVSAGQRKLLKRCISSFAERRPADGGVLADEIDALLGATVEAKPQPPVPPVVPKVVERKPEPPKERKAGELLTLRWEAVPTRPMPK